MCLEVKQTPSPRDSYSRDIKSNGTRSSTWFPPNKHHSGTTTHAYQPSKAVKIAANTCKSVWKHGKHAIPRMYIAARFIGNALDIIYRETNPYSMEAFVLDLIAAGIVLFPAVKASMQGLIARHKPNFDKCYEIKHGIEMHFAAFISIVMLVGRDAYTGACMSIYLQGGIFLVVYTFITFSLLHFTAEDESEASD